VILAACWFAAPHGLTALAWALAGRGVLAMALFVPAMRLGLGRQVMPLLRLMVLPASAMLAARLAGAGALTLLPQTGLPAQLLVAMASASVAFTAVFLVFAPARVARMGHRLRAALIGNNPPERRFI
jgi:hypothetical protein